SFLSCSPDPLSLPSFPTRRSSDLLRSLAISLPLSGPSRFRCWAHSNNKKPECAELFFERWGFTTTLKRENRVDAGRLHKSRQQLDRKSTRLNSSHDQISYAVFCLK